VAGNLVKSVMLKTWQATIVRECDRAEENVTPQRAAELLAGATKVAGWQWSPYDREVVRRYAADMRAGRWRRGTVIFVMQVRGGWPVLRDGHHRLHAVVESGCTVPMFVVSGIDPDRHLPPGDREELLARLDAIRNRGDSWSPRLAALRDQLRGVGAL
jgi:hypothetical protein